MDRAVRSPTGRRNSISPIRRCLCFLFARLQGRRRQSAGRIADVRTAFSQFAQQSDPSADLRAGIHQRLRNRNEEHAARRRDDAERRRLLLQIQGLSDSQIVDRTSINLNFDAKCEGAELEATWEPVPGLRFNFAGGYEDSHARQWLNPPSI